MKKYLLLIWLILGLFPCLRNKKIVIFSQHVIAQSGESFAPDEDCPPDETHETIFIGARKYDHRCKQKYIWSEDDEECEKDGEPCDCIDREILDDVSVCNDRHTSDSQDDDYGAYDYRCTIKRHYDNDLGECVDDDNPECQLVPFCTNNIITEGPVKENENDDGYDQVTYSVLYNCRNGNVINRNIISSEHCQFQTVESTENSEDADNYISKTYNITTDCYNNLIKKILITTITTPKTQCQKLFGKDSYLDDCSKCVKGTSGKKPCKGSCNTTISSNNISLSQVSNNYNFRYTLTSVDYGFTDAEDITITINACSDGDNWHAKLKSIVGLYSERVRLIPGVSQITSNNTTSSNFCAQVYGLKYLGNGTSTWYTIDAVQAHEDVHKSHLLPALESSTHIIDALLNSVTVSDNGQSENDAITSLTSSSQFNNVVSQAKSYWRTLFNLDCVGDNGKKTDDAEHQIADPIRIQICNLANANSWPKCVYCN